MSAALTKLRSRRTVSQPRTQHRWVSLFLVYSSDFGNYLAPGHLGSGFKNNRIGMPSSVLKSENESPPKRRKMPALPDTLSTRDRFLSLNEGNALLPLFSTAQLAFDERFDSAGLALLH